MPLVRNFVRGARDHLRFQVSHEVLATPGPNPVTDHVRLQIHFGMPDRGRKARLRLRTALFVAAGLMASVSPLGAQTLDSTALRRAVAQGAAVAVAVDGETEPKRGLLRDIDPSTVLLEIDGQRTPIELRTVGSIERRGDSLLNGTLIGMGIAGGWCAWVCGQGSGRPLSYAFIVAGNAAIGGLIGAWADAVREGTTTIYRRAPERDVQVTFTGTAFAVRASF